jgi:hypothetical protein
MPLLNRSLWVVVLAAAVFAGCGSSASSKVATTSAAESARTVTETLTHTEKLRSVASDDPLMTTKPVTLIDPAGDQQDGNYGKHPDRGDLDIRKVVLDIDGTDVIATWTLAKAPTADIIYVFEASNNVGNGLTTVETRRDKAGGALKTSYYGDDAHNYPLDGAATIVGNQLTLTMSLGIFETAPPFQWKVSVATRSDPLEVSDDAPDWSDDDDNVPMVSFG